MIKGKAKMEFGTGDIRMTGALSGGIGALCCITQKPHGIGERVPVEDSWKVDRAEVIMTFTKTESIDALVAELQDVKAMMDGSYPFEKTEIRDEELNFNAFMQAQEDDINGLREKIETLGYKISEEEMQKLLLILQVVENMQMGNGVEERTRALEKALVAAGRKL